MKGPVEVAAVVGSYSSFQVPVLGFMVPMDMTIHLEEHIKITVVVMVQVQVAIKDSLMDVESIEVKREGHMRM
ncbi:hypothetical protein ACH5RR_041101 [Cinchona calisaya]|uniref:Uncharacterized protein n=1 Tax=Cinchona calisaya TaxID=153742 RepID=A0ABD2XVT8_9GENT